MQPERAGKTTAAKWLLLTFIAVALLAASVAFWQWQPLPSDMRSAKYEAVSQMVPMDAHTYLRARPFDALAYVGVADALSSVRPAPATAKVTTQEVLDIATLLAPVDIVVMRTRIADAYARNDALRAMALSADLAALSPNDQADAFASLANLMPTREWPRFIAARLASGWTAAGAFVLHICYSNAKPDVLLPLAIAVVKKEPLQATALNCVAAKAIADNKTPLAYWLWLSSAPKLPKKIPFVLNGDFESPSASGPFEWALGLGGDFREGFTVGIRRDNETATTDNGVLMARLNGRAVHSPLVQQNLALTPGRYRLSYRLQTSGLTADKLAWTIRCGASVLALSNLTKSDRLPNAKWDAFSTEFTVPPTCTGQSLALEVATRLDALQGLVGIAKYDDVIVTRFQDRAGFGSLSTKNPG